MVLVDLLRQDRNPGIRDSTNLSTAHVAATEHGWHAFPFRPRDKRPAGGHLATALALLASADQR
ncbi:hypothetical protein ACFW2Y_34815 [Streptomyces sp. NPDC058877]|uniref:hypothetical protein n=1 Tax=Streptomyces sp. NPDC058877 TaxID=3346665 RepID=UPI0036C084CC